MVVAVVEMRLEDIQVVVEVEMRLDAGTGVGVGVVTLIEAEKYVCHPLASASCYQKSDHLFSLQYGPHWLVKAKHHHGPCLKQHLQQALSKH